MTTLQELWDATNDLYDEGKLTKADWLKHVREAWKLGAGGEDLQPLMQLGLIESFVDEDGMRELLAELARGR